VVGCCPRGQSRTKRDTDTKDRCERSTEKTHLGKLRRKGERNKGDNKKERGQGILVKSNALSLSNTAEKGENMLCKNPDEFRNRGAVREHSTTVTKREKGSTWVHTGRRDPLPRVWAQAGVGTVETVWGKKKSKGIRER